MDDPRRCKFDVAGACRFRARSNDALESDLRADRRSGRRDLPGAAVWRRRARTRAGHSWITGGTAPAPPQAGPVCGLHSAPGSSAISSSTIRPGTTRKYDIEELKKETALGGELSSMPPIPNLDAFKAKGGKTDSVARLVRSRADAARAASATTSRSTRGTRTRSDYFRTFLLPGVLHCGGGAGPDNADWPAAICRLGRKRPSTAARRRAEDGERRRDANPPAVRVSAEGRVQADRAARTTRRTSCAGRARRDTKSRATKARKLEEIWVFVSSWSSWRPVLAGVRPPSALRADRGRSPLRRSE